MRFLVLAALIAAQNPAMPQTRAELTRFEETSRYEEVRAFLDALVPTGRVRVEPFGRSEEGRELPLAIIGSPPATARPPRASSVPVVLVMANIHAGEVEGKEASLHLMRRMVSGDLQPLLGGAVWLFAPIYNADGNERISLENRVEQYGPIGGVGTRENASGLDLNRDFMKLDTAEGRALAGLLARWDPDVVVDLHTTNGSYHGYHLTYAPALNPNTDPALIAFARERLLPAVRQAMTSRHAWRTYYYGNFATTTAMDAELLEFGATAPGVGDASSAGGASITGDRVWRTFDHRPRFGTTYVGLRNRIAILSEAYSYLDFAGRVRATEAFVEEIMRYVAGNAADITRLTGEADAATVAGLTEQGVSFAIVPSAPAEILIGAVEQKTNPRSGREMIAMIEQRAVPTAMQEFSAFAATQTRRVPSAYVVPARADNVHRTIAERLQSHGIAVRETTAASPQDVDRFIVNAVQRAERPFQKRQETRVTGTWERATVTLPPGSLVVSTRQPLGRLVFYLLEPESDDGLGAWDILGPAVTAGTAHPVFKAR
jgi:hypothetical protein